MMEITKNTETGPQFAGTGYLFREQVVMSGGVPQVTAIMACRSVSAKTGVPIIADGGIKFSGDIPKAIGAGAARRKRLVGALAAGVDSEVAARQRLAHTRGPVGAAQLTSFKYLVEGDGTVSEDLTAATIPKDFARNPRIHNCWRISRKR